MTDQPGIPGQNNPNPPGSFENHFIVLFNNQYYDPSYGDGPYGGQTLDIAHAAWEDASIDGFYEIIQLNGQATVVVKKNAPGVGLNGANIETVFTPVPEN